MLIKDGQTQQLNYFDGSVSLGQLNKDGKYVIQLYSKSREDEIYEGSNFVIENTEKEDIFFTNVAIFT
jgi:hypothetical protein